MCDDRHRHQEWLKFLRAMDEVVRQDKQIHMIVDNCATHKHPRVQRWLDRHPRFRMHFTPTGCSWLNMVERFFRDLTENRLRHEVFPSVEELITAIFDYIDHNNDNPKPFIWTGKAADILEKVKRARAALLVAQNVDRLLHLRAPWRVAAYAALPWELDAAPLIALAQSRGCRVYLPRIDRRRGSREMRFVALDGSARRQRPRVRWLSPA